MIFNKFATTLYAKPAIPKLKTKFESISSAIVKNYKKELVENKVFLKTKNFRTQTSPAKRRISQLEEKPRRQSCFNALYKGYYLISR